MSMSPSVYGDWPETPRAALSAKCRVHQTGLLAIMYLTSIYFKTDYNAWRGIA